MEMRYFTNSKFLIIIIIIASLATFATRCEGWVTNKCKREVPAGYNAPQQVHVTQGNMLALRRAISIERAWFDSCVEQERGDVCVLPRGFKKRKKTQRNIHGNAVTVSWVTPELVRSSSMVAYGTSKHILDELAWGELITRHGYYKYYPYTLKFRHHYNRTSHFIHLCDISNLDFDTKYYFAVGIGYTVRRFWFKTPPRVGPDFGDHRTLKAETVLYGDDLPYADNNRWEWDMWGRFVETTGNGIDELAIDFDPRIVFKKQPRKRDRNAPLPLFPTPWSNCQLPFSKIEICPITLIAFTPCFPYIKTQNSGPASAPSAVCCEIFINAVADRDKCVCSLLWDPLFLDFPVDTNRLVSLFSSCGASVLASSYIHDTCGAYSLPPSSTAHVALRLSGSTSHLYTIQPSGLTPLLRTSLY